MRVGIEYRAFFPILCFVAIGCEDKDVDVINVFALALRFDATCTSWLSKVTLSRSIQRLRAIKPVKEDILLHGAACSQCKRANGQVLQPFCKLSMWTAQGVLRGLELK
jgi:hypothetical protein